MEELELPRLPESSRVNGNENVISINRFTRSKLREVIHELTVELKERGTKTPHILLPFRSKVRDSELESLLKEVFPRGELTDSKKFKGIFNKHNEFTLICLLKYLWCRLPNNEVIGWEMYLEFKSKEKEAGYPRNAFLEIMPKCLLSPAHASIVYDFLDLLISIASNSHYNFLSGRKIAKMSSLWAFNGYNKIRSPFYDATLSGENDFMDGLETWKESSDALFHLLLSFLRSMLPELDTLKLPKTLQSLLITNSYPPLEKSDSVKTIITIPCVIVRSTWPSKDAYELLSKVKNSISFQDKDSFLSIENYTILKNTFKKHSTNDIIASLTDESKRILSRISAEAIDSQFGIYPGWAPPTKPVDKNIPQFSEIIIRNVSLQDYYIWTWLSSLGSDQNSHIKRTFGRSIVVEASLKGFQKWMLVTEKTLNSKEYVKKFKQIPKEPISIANNNNNAVEQGDSIVPPPVPPKEGEIFLPNYFFTDLEEDLKSEDSYIFPSNNKATEEDQTSQYLEASHNNLYRAFSKKLNLQKYEEKTPNRPRPVLLSTEDDLNAARQVERETAISSKALPRKPAAQRKAPMVQHSKSPSPAFTSEIPIKSIYQALHSSDTFGKKKLLRADEYKNDPLEAYDKSISSPLNSSSEEIFKSPRTLNFSDEKPLSGSSSNLSFERDLPSIPPEDMTQMPLGQEESRGIPQNSSFNSEESLIRHYITDTTDDSRMSSRIAKRIEGNNEQKSSSLATHLSQARFKEATPNIQRTDVSYVPPTLPPMPSMLIPGPFLLGVQQRQPPQNGNNRMISLASRNTDATTLDHGYPQASERNETQTFDKIVASNSNVPTSWPKDDIDSVVKSAHSHNGIDVPEPHVSSGNSSMSSTSLERHPGRSPKFSSRDDIPAIPNMKRPIGVTYDSKSKHTGSEVYPSYDNSQRGFQEHPNPRHYMPPQNELARTPEIPRNNNNVGNNVSVDVRQDAYRYAPMYSSPNHIQPQNYVQPNVVYGDVPTYYDPRLNYHDSRSEQLYIPNRNYNNQRVHAAPTAHQLHPMPQPIMRPPASYYSPTESMMHTQRRPGTQSNDFIRGVVPPATRHNKGYKSNQANLRAAFNSSNFGI